MSVTPVVVQVPKHRVNGRGLVTRPRSALIAPPLLAAIGASDVGVNAAYAVATCNRGIQRARCARFAATRRPPYC